MPRTKRCAKKGSPTLGTMGVEGTRSLPGSSSSTRDTVGGSVLEPQVTLSQALMDLECSTRSRVKLQRPSSASTWQVVDQGEVQSNSPHSLVGHYHQGGPVTLQPSSARLGEVTRRVEGDRILGRCVLWATSGTVLSVRFIPQVYLRNLSRPRAHFRRTAWTLRGPLPQRRCVLLRCQ